MAGYIGLPTLSIPLLMPGRMSFDTPGAAIEGGRNGLGQSISIGLSGGPQLVGSYGECFVQSPDQHQYLNWVAARCNSSIRFVDVPIMSEWMGPFPQDANGNPLPRITGIPHSDGSLFSDGSGYSQLTVVAEMAEAAALNAGLIKVRVRGAVRPLRLSDWMGFNHSVKGRRVTRSYDMLAQTGDDVSDAVYTLAIEIPLRQAVALGDAVDLYRPLCAMKFPADFTLAWEVESFWLSQPTLNFVEAF